MNVIERPLEIFRPDATMNVWRIAPDEPGRYPAVLVLMDAPGLRPALVDLAARIAAAGYLVWLPNLYYRIGRDIHFGPTRAHPDADANRERMFACIRSLTNQIVVDDVTALADALAGDEAWDGRPIGITGYCMSGLFATLAAHALGDRVACAASYFGTRLVTEEKDSPHLMLGATRAELYFAFAEHDPYVPPQIADALRDGLRVGPVRARVETYPGTDHGFVFPDRGSYNVCGASRHWDTLLDLLSRCLKHPA